MPEAKFKEDVMFSFFFVSYILCWESQQYSQIIETQQKTYYKNENVIHF